MSKFHDRVPTFAPCIVRFSDIFSYEKFEVNTLEELSTVLYNESCNFIGQDNKVKFRDEFIEKYNVWAALGSNRGFDISFTFIGTDTRISDAK